MNDSAHYLDRQIERFYDAVFEICEDICHSREEANDFIQFIEKEHHYLVQPIAPIGVIESFIAIKDEEGDPWRLKVHDGKVSYTVPTIDSTDTDTNKTLTNCYFILQFLLFVDLMYTL